MRALSLSLMMWQRKIPEENAEKLPEPSYKLLTSAGSEQWGWILEEPEEDRARVENLLDGFGSSGAST